MLVATLSIIEHLDVIEDVGPCQFTGFVDPFADALLLQTAKEELRHRVVPAAAAAAHAGHEVVLAAEPLPVITAIL